MQELWQRKEVLDASCAAAVVNLCEGVFLLQVGHRFAFVHERAAAEGVEATLPEFSQGIIQSDDEWIIQLSTLPHREGCSLSRAEKGAIAEEGAKRPSGMVTGE